MPHDGRAALQPCGDPDPGGRRAGLCPVRCLVGGAARAAGTASPSPRPFARCRDGRGGAAFQLMAGDQATVLPEVRGRIERNRKLAPLSWLRAGGPAEIFFMPADREDLAEFLAALDPSVPVMPLGVCSNLIIRDGGLKGVAIRLGRAFNTVEALPGHRIRAGAAALDAHVARRAAEFGIASLEFLRTIPSAMGGAVKVNVCCYGSYLADVLVEVVMIDRQGRTHELGPKDLDFGYRSSAVPDDAVIVEAVLQGREGDPAEITARMEVVL